MKKIQQIGMVILLVIASTTFNACKKPEKGEQGPPGNANILNYSITISPWQWSWNSTYNQWEYKYYNNINSQSAILCYVMTGNGQEVMPFYDQTSFTTTTFAKNLYMSPSYIQFEYYNGSGSLTAPINDKYVYIVAIPPAIIKDNPDLDFKNLKMVKERFNLKD